MTADYWIRRGDWCKRHGQPVYVDHGDWADVCTVAEETEAEYEADRSQLESLLTQLGARPLADRDRPPLPDPSQPPPPGSMLMGAPIVYDVRKASRQRRLFNSGKRMVLMKGGPLDGDISTDEGARQTVAGEDGYYQPVGDGRRAIGWLWVPGSQST